MERGKFELFHNNPKKSQPSKQCHKRSTRSTPKNPVIQEAREQQKNGQPARKPLRTVEQKRIPTKNQNSKNDIRGCKAVKDKNKPVHEWSSIRATPPNFEFKQTPGLKLQTGACESPSQFIDLFLDDTFLDLLVVETNKYARAVIEAKGELKPSSRLKAWTETNKAEMKIFLVSSHGSGFLANYTTLLA
ncbi:hypothetical protein HA402_014263 [Bradysia odoriphaga]|nr:hypothetical protein HA402_014263 [Bradysia odoriphaga]